MMDEAISRLLKLTPMPQSQPQPKSQPKLLTSAEKAFLDEYDVTRYERPSVTVDVVLLALKDGQLHTLLIRRPDQPEQGQWALPGGFVKMDESLDAAARRVLQAKTGLEHIFLEQLYTFGQPDRDPRTRVISVAYYALIDWALIDWPRFSELKVPQENATLARLQVSKAGVLPLSLAVKSASNKALTLAFDHQDILLMALQRLRGKIDYAPIGFELLPPAFTLHQLQKVHEAVLGRKLNKDSFRRRMLASGQLEATGDIQQEVDHRPAALYRLKHA